MRKQCVTMCNLDGLWIGRQWEVVGALLLLLLLRGVSSVERLNTNTRHQE